MDPTSTPTPSAPAERPRLNLKPRDPEAAKREEERRRQELAAKGNPFGAARPREAVLAEKMGKKEEELLAEEARRSKLNLRLNAQQLEEKRAAEALVQETKDTLGREDLPSEERPQLERQLAEREAALEELLKRFEQVTLEKVEKGEITRQSELRARQQQQQVAMGGAVPPEAMGAVPYPPRAPFPAAPGRGPNPAFQPNAPYGGRGAPGGRGYPQHYNPHPVQAPGFDAGMGIGQQPVATGGYGGRGGGRGAGGYGPGPNGPNPNYYNGGGRGRGRGPQQPFYPPPPPKAGPAAPVAPAGPRDPFFDTFSNSAAPPGPPGFAPGPTTGGYVDYQAGAPIFKQDRF